MDFATLWFAPSIDVFGFTFGQTIVFDRAKDNHGDGAVWAYSGIDGGVHRALRTVRRLSALGHVFAFESCRDRFQAGQKAFGLLYTAASGDGLGNSVDEAVGDVPSG